ncbi:hypothetical protein FJZ40_01595 [Candidatus Shapirobacteria bacterium]|nr:hypothetical protein [Candidatus Shapirobacteria bacterium]
MKYYAKKIFPILAVLVLSFFSYHSLLKPGYFPMHDDIQVIRVLQIDKCLKDGQFPCRWVPDMGYGYGYPQFIYYGPLPYYVMEGFHLEGWQFIDAVKAGFALSVVLSGLAMFILGRSLWGNLGGLVSAIFYVYAPYRASDIYSRGAVGEFWSFVFLPLILWAILEFTKQEKVKYLLYLALAYAGLLTTHNITSLAFTPVAAVWGVLVLLWFKKVRLLPKLALGAVLGIGLAAFFVLPAIFEKGYVHVETMTYGYFNYLAHFVSLRQMFFSTHWGYGSSELGPYDDLSFMIGFFHWLCALLAVIVSFFYRRKNPFFFFVSLFVLAVFLGAAFMAHQRSVFIWNALPILAYFQFPWRFLTIVAFAGSILPGLLVAKINARGTALALGFVLLFGVIYLNVQYFRPGGWFDISDKEKLSGQLWEKQLTTSIFDYLPKFATMPPTQKASDRPEIVEGQAEITSYEKGTNWQKGEIKVISNGATIRLPLFYFPGFKAYLNGKEIKIDYHNYLGLITLQIPEGDQRIFVSLERTPARWLGDLVSLVSFILVGAFFLKPKRLKLRRR